MAASRTIVFIGGYSEDIRLGTGQLVQGKSKTQPGLDISGPVFLSFLPAVSREALCLLPAAQCPWFSHPWQPIGLDRSASESSAI